MTDFVRIGRTSARDDGGDHIAGNGTGAIRLRFTAEPTLRKKDWTIDEVPEYRRSSDSEVEVCAGLVAEHACGEITASWLGYRPGGRS
jgi:hypothetical protein